MAQGPCLRRQNTEGCKKIVTLFSYVERPSAMKFGSVRGLANWHSFPEFCELWSGGPAIPCGDMHQSFTCYYYAASPYYVRRCGLLLQTE